VRQGFCLSFSLYPSYATSGRSHTVHTRGAKYPSRSSKTRRTRDRVLTKFRLRTGILQFRRLVPDQPPAPREELAGIKFPRTSEIRYEHSERTKDLLDELALVRAPATGSDSDSSSLSPHARSAAGRVSVCSSQLAGGARAHTFVSVFPLSSISDSEYGQCRLLPTTRARSSCALQMAEVLLREAVQKSVAVRNVALPRVWSNRGVSAIASILRGATSHISPDRSKTPALTRTGAGVCA
jgi:hypothetical protein